MYGTIPLGSQPLVPIPPGSESNNNNLIPVEPLVYMIMAGSSGFGFTATRLEPWPEMFGTMIRNKNAKNSNVRQNSINSISCFNRLNINL